MEKPVVLITGSTRGIGKAIAKELCQQGYITLVNDKEQENVDKVTSELKNNGGQAFGLALDLSDQGATTQLIGWAIKRFRKLDVLVNNAGLGKLNPFLNANENDLEQVKGINIETLMCLSQAALPYLLESHEKAIVNISSLVVHKTHDKRVLFSSSQYTLWGMLLALLNDYHNQGLRIYNISLGSIYTDILRAECTGMAPSFLIQPKEVAQTVRFFLSLTGNSKVDEIILRRKSNPPILGTQETPGSYKSAKQQMS